MNRLLFITVLFGACLLSVNAGVGGGDGEKLGNDASLKVGADIDVGGVTTTLADVGSGVAEGLGQTLSSVGQGLMAGGAALAKGGGNFVQAIIDFLKRIIEALVGAILGMLNAITEQIDKAEKALFDQVGLKRIGGFRSVVNKLGDSLKEVGTGVLGGLTKIGSGLLNTVQGNVDVDVSAKVGSKGKGHGKGHGKGRPSSGLDEE